MAQPLKLPALQGCSLLLVRFAQTLGFDGFSQMQQIFRGQLVGRNSEYMERLAKIRQSGTNTPGSILGNFVERSKQSLDDLLRQVDTVALERSIEALSAAENIHLLGLGRAYPVVSYLHYTFGKMGVRTNLLEYTGGILEERVQFINENDALFVATFSLTLLKWLSLRARPLGAVSLLCP